MIFSPVDNRLVYAWVDTSLRTLEPLSDYCLDAFKHLNQLSYHVSDIFHVMPYNNLEEHSEFFNISRYWIRILAGSFYVSHMLTDMYHKPEWDIDDVQIGDTYVDVVQEIVFKKPFCELLHFKKIVANEQDYPKLFLVAPLSGHYATLLRDTVRGLLPYYDVYITDWINARDVPLTEGSFDLEKYVQYMIFFMKKLSSNLHVMAVCQATVPVLIALALMSDDNDPHIPLTVSLLGGPIDVEQTPTKVNDLAQTRGKDWFKQNVISIVPSHYAGYMRLVYPGFMQLSSFMSMNINRHIASLQGAIQDYAKDELQDALKTIKFYKEYFSMMDLTAEFYMQTVHSIFQEKLLSQGRLKMKGRYAQLNSIQKTAVFAIEGALDDITGIGQTRAALDLCAHLPDTKKRYLLAEGVGHYGLFNGRKFRNIIVPEIVKFTQEHSQFE